MSLLDWEPSFAWSGTYKSQPTQLEFLNHAKKVSVVHAFMPFHIDTAEPH